MLGDFTAEQARVLAEQQRPIFQEIKDTASRGEFVLYYPMYSLEPKDYERLIEAGYKVVLKNEDECYCISWEEK